MIALTALTFARAGRPLVLDAHLNLHPGWKVGLVGANGSGKSSLFALLSGEIHPESGDATLPPHWVIAHVSQETPPLPTPALEFVLDGDVELRRVEQAMREAELHGHGEEIAALHLRFADLDGYTARARAAEVLHGLGFSQADLARPVAEFSGGWRVRLNLARALSCRADLLLLDEPTNHLDLDAVLWLEGWLKSTPATLLLISHDRDFLDAVVGHILAIEQQRMTLTTGGYSDYERARVARLATQQATFEAQQQQIAHLQKFIDRFKAKASKAKQAQSRVKALARMESVAAAQVDSPFHFSFPSPTDLPDPLLVIHQGAVGYGQHPLLTGLELTLRPGSRVALLGRNGAGKSTLIKLLAGVLPLQQGERHEAKALKIGYFAQHQLEQLRPDETPLWHIQHLEPETPEQVLRDFLGGFNFRGEMATRQVGPFSGGEKSRLALALLIRQKPNLLLLDEPTNHLDLDMREAIVLALQDYTGGVVLVSHDRHLLRTTADELWRVDEGRASMFEGDLDEYAAWLALRRTVDKAAVADDGTGSKAERKQQRAENQAARQNFLKEQRALTRTIAKLDALMATLNEEAERVEAELSDPALYAVGADRLRVDALSQRQTELREQLESCELDWLEAHEKLEDQEKPR